MPIASAFRLCKSSGQSKRFWGDLGACEGTSTSTTPRNRSTPTREVPIGKTYVVYNSQGKKVAVFRSGQKTNMSKKCVQVICTGTDRSGNDVVCWKCRGFAAR